MFCVTVEVSSKTADRQRIDLNSLSFVSEVERHDTELVPLGTRRSRAQTHLPSSF